MKYQVEIGGHESVPVRQLIFAEFQSDLARSHFAATDGPFNSDDPSNLVHAILGKDLSRKI